MAISTYAELKTSVAQEVKYSPETGAFAWLKSARGRRKNRVGALRPDGYTTICIGGKQWLAHRLAWFLHYGEEPPKIIDHINRDKQDNRISNLRDGGDGINEFNARADYDSPFGISGVRSACKVGNYQAYTAQGGRFRSFYHGPDFFEACCARKAWEAEYKRAL